MARDRENLRKLIHESGFGSMEKELMQSARPSIRVYTKAVDDEDQIPIGQSKIGGRPDLPRDVPWIQIEIGNRKPSLPFIAQFNLTEVRPHDEENLLPEQGLLYFFADPFGNGYKGYKSVVYLDVDLAVLERKPFPEDIPPNEPHELGDRYDTCAVEFVPEVNLPFPDPSRPHRREYPEGKDWRDFYDLIYAASYSRSSPTDWPIVNRLLGYNYDVPHDLQLECEAIAEYGSPYNWPSELNEMLVKRKDEWQLLFQMDSDHNAGMMWSDSGSISFYIRRQDLMNLNFNDVCLRLFSA